MDFSQVTPYTYYNTPSLQGSHQYITLANVVNNYMLNYVGDDQIIKKINRYKVLFHAKRGLQELSYDILKDVKAVELTVNPDTLTAILPQGFVDYVRISQVDDNHNFRPLYENTGTVIGDNYLQDNNYNLMFDFNGDILVANKNSFDPTNIPDQTGINNYCLCSGENGYNWINPTSVQDNRWFVLDRRNGVIKFSSIVGDSTLVIEYISDGFDYADETKIVIHKYGEEALYSYISWQLLDNMEGVQEYVVKRKKDQYKAQFNNTAIRNMNLDYTDLARVLKG